MGGVLVIVPCGLSKVWGKNPQAGPTAASLAYTGPPFRLNKRYAERYGNRWVILSAKYGFIPPDFIIPGPYNVTFNRKSTNPVTLAVLTEQVRGMGLDDFEVVIGLGGKEYRSVIEQTFGSSGVELRFPFAGLNIMKMMRATKVSVSQAE
ncbi:MAG TPA: hypothetical protein VF297_24415 [Pyrinomonadaceae bacterium]